MYKTARRKYNSIVTRAFNKYLDLFLVCCYIQNNNLAISAGFAAFAKFNYNHPNIPEALKAYQITKNDISFYGKPISELDDQIKKWHKTAERSAFRNYFKSNNIISWEDFQEVYGSDESSNRSCYYCKITEVQISLLIEKGQIKTKRLKTRGRSMEIERIIPNEGYTKENIALCCYWCNNAKSDEFTDGEFKKLSKGLTKIWEKRLAKAKLIV